MVLVVVRSYFLPFMLTLATCFSVQALGLRAAGGRAAKSESNYFTSLGRIQAAAREKADLALLGSSVTGRLPDRTMGFEGVANVGCDGGTAVDALRAMDKGILPASPCLVIEANYLHRALDAIPSEVAAAMGSLWFDAGTSMPLLGAGARPASFLYSVLLARKIGDTGDPAATEDLQVSSRPVRLRASGTERLLPEERELLGELVPLLSRLQQKGCRIVFVWLPPGREPDKPAPQWITELVAQSNCEWWDLGTAANPELVVLTDGVHMAASSAARTMRSLRTGLANTAPAQSN